MYNKLFAKELRDDLNFMSPVERSNYMKKIAINNILNNKTAFIKVSFIRIKNFFHPKPNPYSDFKKRDFAMILFYTPILLFFSQVC